MSLFQILKDSFELLADRPKLFVPRFISTLTSSTLLVLWITGYISTVLFAALFPLTAVLGIFTPLIVSSMVEKKSKERLLTKGFKEALDLWKQVLLLSLITLVLAFVNSLPLSFGLVATMITRNILFLILGSSLSLAMLFAVSWGIYFMPISMIKEHNFSKAVKNALNTSSENNKEVVVLTLFSLAVLGAASFTTGYLRDIGILVFLIGRILSSIVGTYILVISPNYYLQQRHSK